jgi:outer membrane receptor for Fe3+-dicitrate
VEHYQLETTGGSPDMAGVSDQYRTVNDTTAAYATFQQPIGDWTAMPGIRIEQNHRSIAGPGFPDVRIRRTDLFPTFHIEHHLLKTLDLTLSYSKRIDRAQAAYLRPYRVFEDALTSMQGNPQLKDQSTDAYELNLHYRHKRVDAGLIVYDRETSRLWSNTYTVIDGVNIYTWINSGHRSDRGAEVDLSTPIVRRLKWNMSVNLFDERAPIATTLGSKIDNSFRYTTNTTVEWDGPDRGKVPGDVAQVGWQYSSPSKQFQFRYLPTTSLNASYTHSFSRTLSVGGTLDYSGSNRHRLIAPLVQEYYTSHVPLQFKIKLLKRLGTPS